MLKQMSRGETVRAGYLTKSPPESKVKVAQWHKRWFLLMDSRLVYPLADRYVRLEYYQSEAEAKRLADPKGMINLKDCDKVISREPIRGHRHVFDVCTEERTYHLCAETAEEKHEWIDTLNTLLFTEQNNRHRRWSPPQQRADFIARLRLQSAGRTQRPLSFTGSPSTTHAPRPLPPVPPAGSPVNHRRRPLPPTPVVAAAGVHINTPAPSVQKSSPRSKRKREPPVKPPPYAKSVSVVPQPTRPIDISEHYEVGPGQQPKVSPRSKRNARMGGQSRSLDEDLISPISGNADEEYTVLQVSKVTGYDPANRDYSHLETNGSTVHCTPNPKLSHQRAPAKGKRDYVNLAHLASPENEEYSHLRY